MKRYLGHKKTTKKRSKKIMKTRIENKYFGRQKASKQSIKLFQQLIYFHDKKYRILCRHRN